MLAQVVEALPPTEETFTEFLASGFSLALSWLLWVFGSEPGDE